MRKSLGSKRKELGQHDIERLVGLHGRFEELRHVKVSDVRGNVISVGFGGLRPYFQIHTHKFNLVAFNEAGWDECYACCAELYALHPTVLGLFGSSWLYDSALDSVSPRLPYLRKTPVAGGASTFFFEEGGHAIANSTSTSPARRALFESGSYLPKSYMLVWDKASQIRWAQQFAERTA